MEVTITPTIMDQAIIAIHQLDTHGTLLRVVQPVAHTETSKVVYAMMEMILLISKRKNVVIDLSSVWTRGRRLKSSMNRSANM